MVEDKNTIQSYYLNKQIVLYNHLTYLPCDRILIISDLHLGNKKSKINNGYHPIFFNQFDLLKIIKTAIKKFNPNKIILNGDLQHDFAKISIAEREFIRHLIDIKKKSGFAIILIKGNHDTLIEYAFKNADLNIEDYYLTTDKIFICHGHKLINCNELKISKSIIIGHLHPAILLDDGVRKEKYPCYCYGTYKNKNLLIMPAFNELNSGIDLNSLEKTSPFLIYKNMRNFKIYIDYKKIYYFGKLKDITKLQIYSDN